MLKSHILLEDAPTQHPPAPPSKGDDDPRPAPDEKCVARPPESLPAYGGLARLWWACPPMVGLPACGGLARLWWACPPTPGGARTNPLRITASYAKLTPPGETEAGNPGEESIAPTGTFRSAERRAKGYFGQACPPVEGLSASGGLIRP